MWGAYDISRIAGETGWAPRPMREALHAYMEWIAAERRLEGLEEPR
jgi:nucleoside-diphosphate-sugar epimerase